MTQSERIAKLERIVRWQYRVAFAGAFVAALLFVCSAADKSTTGLETDSLAIKHDNKIVLRITNTGTIEWVSDEDSVVATLTAEKVNQTPTTSDVDKINAFLTRNFSEEGNLLNVKQASRSQEGFSTAG